MQDPRSTFIYLAVVFGLLVIPRALQRFRLPAQLTCFAFSIILAGFFKPLVNDTVISYLSTLGIASLFLFAGLEVEKQSAQKRVRDLQRDDLSADRGHRGLECLLRMRGHDRITGCARMDAVHCQRRNVVLTVCRDQQGVIIDDLNALVRSELHQPLVELIDALEPLRARIGLFRQGSRSPWRDGSNHHGDVVRFCFLHHGLDVG